MIEEWNQHKSGKRTITGGLYTLANKLESISRKIENLEAQGLNRVEHKQKTPIRCPHCTVPLGYLDVTLKLTVPHAELKRETWEQYYASMGTPPVTVRAKVASDLGFENWDALKRWADNPDLPKLLEMAEQFKSKLSELDIDASLTYDFSTKLNNLVDTLPKAIRERKRRVVEAVVDLAQEEAAQRTR